MHDLRDKVHCPFQTTSFRLFQTEKVSKTTILDWMKTAVTMFYKSVENMGKGEIARYEQFLLFP